MNKISTIFSIVFGIIGTYLCLKFGIDGRAVIGIDLLIGSCALFKIV